MLSKYIGAPFAVGLIIFLTLTLTVSSSYAFWIIPCFVALAVLYSLHPQIDWWWTKNHPPVMDPKLELWIKKISPFYNSLDEEEGKKFVNRILLYLMANEYLLRGPEDFGNMPDDLKSLFAVPLVEMTFREEDNWRMKKFERLIFYPNRFPSPNFPTFIHSSELEPTDGVIIAALSEVLAWVDKPEETLSILHYEYAKAYILTFRNKKYPAMPSWEILDKIGGFSEEQLQEIIGLPQVDPMAVLMTYYFTCKEEMKKEAPEIFKELEITFGRS